MQTVTEIIAQIFLDLSEEYAQMSIEKIATGFCKVKTEDERYYIKVSDFMQSQKSVTFRCGLVSNVDFVENDGCKYDFEWDDETLSLTKNGEVVAEMKRYK